MRIALWHGQASEACLPSVLRVHLPWCSAPPDVLCHACRQAQLAYPVGASKNSVPLMMTRWAGVLTPHARVEVATRICEQAEQVVRQLAAWLWADLQHAAEVTQLCSCSQQAQLAW